MASAAVRSKVVFFVVVYSMFVVAPIVCGGLVLVPCFVLQHFVSTFSIFSLGKREPVALLLLCSGCYVAGIVLCLFLAVP